MIYTPDLDDVIETLQAQTKPLKPIDTANAPPGCVAIDVIDFDTPCLGCAFWGHVDKFRRCTRPALSIVSCMAHRRPDGRAVIFINTVSVIVTH